MKRYTFPKSEHLYKKKDIALLFDKADFFKTAHFSVLYFFLEESSSVPVQVLVSVPKKNCRLSVRRNLIKRRIRESYRLNKFSLYDTVAQHNKTLYLGFIYQSKQCLDFKTIETEITEALNQIRKILV